MRKEKLPQIFVLCAATFLSIAACSRYDGDVTQPGADFKHGLQTSATPWNHEKFDDADDKFTFAVFSDLTGGEREGVFSVAARQLALLRPELILSVGDLIEGGTTDRVQLAKEWDSFDERADKAAAPVFRVGGNHDLTNVVMREVWEQRYGARYYHFRYKNVLFLILDTEDYAEERLQEIYLARAAAMKVVAEKGWSAFDETEYANMPEQVHGGVSAEQAAYFQKAISANRDVNWTYLLMHKAAWENEADENFTAIEDALSARPYTVFHGHVHAYAWQERNGRDYVRLGTTGGVQFTDRPMSLDHITLVTVSSAGQNIANLKMSGIFDKTGNIPNGGNELCFDASVCAEQ